MKYLYCAALALVALSCKKKNDDEATSTTTPSKEQLAGTYKQTGETYGGMNVWGGSSSFYQACEMDDTYTLNMNNTYNRADAGTTCSSSTASTGSWNVNGSTFTFDGENWNIESFGGGALVIKQTETISGMPITTVRTYQRQ